MALKDNFSNPKGFIGRLMLSGMNMGHSPMAKWTFEHIKAAPDADVADIGCGGGYNIKRFLKLCPQGHVFGVDISEESVKKSQAVNRKELGRRCKITQGSAEKLPFKSESLDIVTAFETIYFWPDLSENFREVYRVLKSDGQFIVSNDSGDPDAHWEDKIPGMKMYQNDEIKRYMEDAGFFDVEIFTEKNMVCVIGHKE